MAVTKTAVTPVENDMFEDEPTVSRTIKPSTFVSNPDPVQNVLRQLRGVKKVGSDKWKAICPAHDDSNASLSIGVGKDGRALLHCFAGCNVKDITARIGLEDRELFSSNTMPYTDIASAFKSDAKEILQVPSDPMAELAARGFRVRTYAEIERKPLEWLWPNYLALGTINVCAGFGGVGKSCVTCDLAARVSRGAPWPCNNGNAPLGDVILLNMEDSPENTLGYRLDAAGADSNRIIELSHSGKQITLENVNELELTLMARPETKLLVIDPMGACYGKADAHKNSETRALLAPIAALAQRYKICVLIVTHFNKSGNGKQTAIERVSDSVALVNAARSGLSVVKDGKEPKRRLVTQLKNNLGEDQKGFAYRVVDSGLRDARGQVIVRVEWEDQYITITADEALSNLDDGPSDYRRSEAREWLADLLTEKPLAAVFIGQCAKQAGISPRTLDNAKADLKVISERHGFGSGSKLFWRLPETYRAIKNESESKNYSLLDKPW